MTNFLSHPIRRQSDGHGFDNSPRITNSSQSLFLTSWKMRISDLWFCLEDFAVLFFVQKCSEVSVLRQPLRTTQMELSLNPFGSLPRDVQSAGLSPVLTCCQQHPAVKRCIFATLFATIVLVLPLFKPKQLWNHSIDIPWCNPSPWPLLFQLSKGHQVMLHPNSNVKRIWPSLEPLVN